MKHVIAVGAVLLAILGFSVTARADEPPPAPKAAHAEGGKDSAKEDADDESPKHPVVTYTIDLEMESLTKFELAAGTVNVEFVMAVTCDQEPCHPSLEIGNGKLLGKPEKIHDEPLHKKFRMKAELDTYIDLSAYPFDSHELALELYEKKDPFQTKLKAGTFEANDRMRLPGWIINDHPHIAIEQIDDGDKEKQDQYSFALTIDRPRMPQAFKSLLPVFFMLVVASVGLFLRPKSVSARFSASTGGLVPLVMFHVGQIASLPPVGYLTRLDKLMIASYCAFVVHIIFNLLMMRAEETKNEARSASLYRTASIAVPLVAVALWAVAMFV